LEIAECNGKLPVTDVVRWHSDDPLVIAVDSVTGVATGLSSGATAVQARGKNYPYLGGILVTVTP
jgi:hypothetical protein